MNIIIPLGGKGERFSKNGYKQPKPLIPIFEKCMIEYVLDNLHLNENDVIFIFYNENLDIHSFTSLLSSKYNKDKELISFIKIGDTRGAAETLLFGIQQILNGNKKYNEKSIILDCDTFYTENIIDVFRKGNDNMVFFTKNYGPEPIYSYITLNHENTIVDIKEKDKISDNANTGAYAFINFIQLRDFAKHVVDNGIFYKNEPYTSCVISEMLKQSIVFKGIELQESRVFSLGTPSAVTQYVDSTYAFLFDLDGTLVITDDIYYDVWSQILNRYHITLTKDLFSKFIQGNNDKYVIHSLLGSHLNIDIDEISQIKDQLFIENISKIKEIDGAVAILNSIKLSGYKACIVTNCNRKVAESIVNYIHIDKYIDFIISNDDCIHAKPHPEPYLNAIQKYNIQSKKCFIFEDSNSGILSAKSIHPRLLIGLETIYNSEQLKNYGVDFSIANYTDFDIESLISYQGDKSRMIIKEIATNMNCSIDNVIIDKNKLKGGFIADVIGFTVCDNSGDSILSYVLKYENSDMNMLSNMAKQLQLYSREYYFYEHISKYVPVHVPRFICLLKNDEFDNCGIILENMFELGYRLNINLNNETIDISMKIVDRMAKLHSHFWNKNLKHIFPELKQNDDTIFCPFFSNFIKEKQDCFIQKWSSLLNPYQLEKCLYIIEHFDSIQKRVCQDNLTFIHGDIKSPNIFYDVKNNYEPYFLDWQHCAIGKGVQDLIFFIIESFDINNVILAYNLLKPYYYKKLCEYNVNQYSYHQYELDLIDALYYIPIFTSIWFGTIPQDDLIDKNFPYFFINKLFYLIEYVTKK
uniref:CHK kinase-like domain-containing protein n=1 Tax=viral metagenome TaxID=1070528 RepID=A0A6C0ARX2_9ZZZZ